ncbi:MAG: M16 family metallopeptidase [Armatimonadota bacterium]
MRSSLILRGVLSLALFMCLSLASFAADVTETVLPNGLKVLIKEVHAAPVVVVDVWYKVGSRNERPGITGASHLLEHMTYKGTREFGKDEMRTLTKRNGAIDNGATFYDYTHYYTTIASDRVELPLRVEASRMSTALIEQKELDQERVVVRSELEGRENSPGSVLFQEMMAAAFKAHPYQWPVIGWRDDVEHTTAAELREYYKTYYIPNNATLVIVGDVNTEKTLALVRKHFGKLKRGTPPPQWSTPEPAQRGERRVTVQRQGGVPIEQIAWHVPAVSDKDTPALVMLEQILGSGRLSRTYQAVVEKQIGVSAWAGSLLLRDSGLFLVGGAVSPGQQLKPVEEVLLAEVERIKTEPPTKAEMARALRQAEASFIFARDSVTQQADQLGEYETIAGDWRLLEKLPELLRAVTPEDVSRVAKTYLTAEGRTVAIYQPTAPAKKTASVGPMIATPAAYRPNNAVERIPLGARPAVASPAAAPAAARRERFVLPNGVVLIVQENHANSTVAISSSLRAGKAYDPPGKSGLAEMIANLLDRGTATRNSTRIAEEMEGAAADISAGTGWETVGIRGKALSGDTELLVRNLADLIRNPIFPADELEKMREQVQAGLQMDRDQPSENAYREFYRAVLPVGHPYRVASFDEEEAGLKSITRDDLLAFHKARYTPQTLVLAVVGDVKVDEVRALVDRYFGDWQGPEFTPLTFPDTAAKSDKVVKSIPDKSQVDIYIGGPGGLKRTDPDFYAAQIMNLILGGGGALNSRLGDVVRDQHGLAYSVYSTFHASTGAGPWYAALGVNPKNTDKAVELVKQEIARMRDGGATQRELDDAVAFVTGAHAIALETNAAIANELMDTEYFKLGLDYPERVTSLYRAITLEQVNAAAKKYLHPEKLVVSIAGPY